MLQDLGLQRTVAKGDCNDAHHTALASAAIVRQQLRLEVMEVQVMHKTPYAFRKANISTLSTFIHVGPSHLSPSSSCLQITSTCMYMAAASYHSMARTTHAMLMTLFHVNTSTMRSIFAQQDHMQVFKFVLDCLDVFHI